VGHPHCTLLHQFNAAAIMLVQAVSLLAGSNPAAREEECKFHRSASNHVYVCVHVAPALLAILVRRIEQVQSP
jgi:hypothetical protein